MEDKLVVIYETMDKVEIIRNPDVLFVPRKGDLVNFKDVKTGLPDWQKKQIT
jgi:hypothetical protein